jgi:hypothetical protein
MILTEPLNLAFQCFIPVSPPYPHIRFEQNLPFDSRYSNPFAPAIGMPPAPLIFRSILGPRNRGAML